MDPKGKVVMESILETKASTILEFLTALRGPLWVSYEEGTWQLSERLLVRITRPNCRFPDQLL
jgi:hypothetical protein